MWGGREARFAMAATMSVIIADVLGAEAGRQGGRSVGINSMENMLPWAKERKQI
jgi:hypothetical protein